MNDTIRREDAIKVIKSMKYRLTIGSTFEFLLQRFSEIPSADKSGKWLEKEVVSPIDDAPPIEEWQSARCSECGGYHTTPYMYYFDDFDFCPNCGNRMKGADDE